MKTIYKIDSDGFMQYGQELQIKEDETMLENYVDTPLPRNENDDQFPFYRPKWTGTEWVEDMSQVDIDALNNIPTPLTIEDRVTNTEIDVVTLEETIDTIFGGM